MNRTMGSKKTLPFKEASSSKPLSASKWCEWLLSPARDGSHIFTGGKWHLLKTENGDSDAERARPVLFSDIMFFYANLIDYARVVLIVLAGFLIPRGYAFAAASAILISHLLDWIDGPVARAYNQCSLFGSMIDWLADVQAQLLTALWWTALEPAALPWVSLAVLIELCCCIFDIAATVTGHYPRLAQRQASPLHKILEWATPNGGYTWLGTFLWLAYPIFCLARILDLTYGNDRSELTGHLLVGTQIFLFVPTIMYLWNEFSQMSLVLSAWREPSREVISPPLAAELDHSASSSMNGVSVRPASAAAIAQTAPSPDERALRSPGSFDDRSFMIVGSCANNERTLIANALEVIKAQPAWQKRVGGSEIYWLNLLQRDMSTRSELREQIPDIEQLDLLAQQLVAKHFADEPTTELEGHGFIINPVGSRTQVWHQDYSSDHASLFIPVEGLTVDNATQYLAFEESDRDAANALIADPDKVDPDIFLRAFGHLSVRQLVASHFDVTRMNFGCVHRGIANRSATYRVIFWISVIRNGAKSITEPAITDFILE